MNNRGDREAFRIVGRTSGDSSASLHVDDGREQDALAIVEQADARRVRKFYELREVRRESTGRPEPYFGADALRDAAEIVFCHQS